MQPIIKTANHTVLLPTAIWLGAGVKTADELGDLDTEELVEKTGLDEEAASKLIMAARASWAE